MPACSAWKSSSTKLMRARQRHLNSAHAGATIALDARFLDLENSDPVSTWTGRAGTAVSPTTSGTSRPLYETNGINGAAALNFDGSNDFFNLSVNVPASFAFFSVHTRPIAGTHTLALGSNISGHGPYTPWWFSNNIIYTSPLTTGTVQTHGTASTATGSFVISQTKTGTTEATVYRDGIMVGAPQTPPESANTYLFLGRRYTSYNKGKMGCVTLIPNEISSALFKRLELSAAFSFKIACN